MSFLSVDFTFGTQWTTHCFEKGNYVQKDLNMPKMLPDRKETAWVKDSPLTAIGLYQAKLIGTSLKENGMTFQHVFSSPSYRCVQTCDQVLKAMDIDTTVKINIEPGFFEWLAWYQDELPDWCSDEELSKSFNINTQYKCVFNAEDLETHYQENLEGFYNRNSSTLQKALENLGNFFPNFLEVKLIKFS
jgi:ubiquitin-associated SH3 domain-containing protein